MRHWMVIILTMVWRKMEILISRKDIIYVLQLNTSSSWDDQNQRQCDARLTVNNSNPYFRDRLLSRLLSPQCYYSRSICCDTVLSLITFIYCPILFIIWYLISAFTKAKKSLCLFGARLERKSGELDRIWNLKSVGSIQRNVPKTMAFHLQAGTRWLTRNGLKLNK